MDSSGEILSGVVLCLRISIVEECAFKATYLLQFVESWRLASKLALILDMVYANRGMCVCVCLLFLLYSHWLQCGNSDLQ